MKIIVHCQMDMDGGMGERMNPTDRPENFGDSVRFVNALRIVERGSGSCGGARRSVLAGEGQRRRACPSERHRNDQRGELVEHARVQSHVVVRVVGLGVAWAQVELSVNCDRDSL